MTRLVGPVPVDKPAFETPFFVKDNQVFAANDEYLFTIEGEDSTGEQDDALAELIAQLVNGHAAGGVLRSAEGSKLRTAKAVDAADTGYLAYEVSPGLFWNARSRRQAERELAQSETRGWPITEHDDYRDIETGEKIEPTE